MDNCMICDRIELIKSGENPYFVRELNTGYVVIGDCQRIRGYSLFLCKEHATELHFLESEFRAMVPVGDVAGCGGGLPGL